MVAFVPFIPVIVGLISFGGIIFANKFMVVIGALMFLYYFGGVLSLPPFMWLIVAIVLALTIFRGGNK